MTDPRTTPTIGYRCNICHTTLLNDGTPLPPLDALVELTIAHDANENHQRPAPDLADLILEYQRIATRSKPQ